jgi:hypothetical protein
MLVTQSRCFGGELTKILISVAVTFEFPKTVSRLTKFTVICDVMQIGTRLHVITSQKIIMLINYKNRLQDSLTSLLILTL